MSDFWNSWNYKNGAECGNVCFFISMERWWSWEWMHFSSFFVIWCFFVFNCFYFWWKVRSDLSDCVSFALLARLGVMCFFTYFSFLFFFVVSSCVDFYTFYIMMASLLNRIYEFCMILCCAPCNFMSYHKSLIFFIAETYEQTSDLNDDTTLAGNHGNWA